MEVLKKNNNNKGIFKNWATQIKINGRYRAEKFNQHKNNSENVVNHQTCHTLDICYTISGVAPHIITFTVLESISMHQNELTK